MAAEVQCWRVRIANKGCVCIVKLCGMRGLAAKNSTGGTRKRMKRKTPCFTSSPPKISGNNVQTATYIFLTMTRPVVTLCSAGVAGVDSVTVAGLLMVVMEHTSHIRSDSIKGFTLFNQRGGKAGDNSPESDQINEELPLSENSRKLSESMSAFFKKAEEQLIKVQSQQSAALSMVKEITEYFHGNSVKEEARPFRIFMVVRDFLSNLDQVCKEVSSACQFPAPIYTSLPPLFPELSGSQTYSTSDDESSFSS
ncbi:hypothetical protein ACET3Z_024907 [Daucus carota]